MGRKAKIAVVTGVVILVLGAVGAYAYDSSRDGEIADGVTIAGVAVGGMSPAEAKRAVRRELLAPLRHSLRVGYNGNSWTLDGSGLRLHADLDRAVEDALAASREGGLPGRLVRYVSGGEVDKNVSTGITYSQRAVNRFVRRVAAAVDREAQNADVEPSGDSLNVTQAKYGRRLRDNLLTRQIDAAVLNAQADHTIAAHTHPLKPEVTASEVASRYPSYLTLDRATFTLRLWEHLKLAKTYTVAVGQEGLETPEGLYDIQEKQENPSWHVPNSAWAGDLAGQVIPPGPEDPIKARWMGIFEGAGIHGTEEIESLGSAASHGCVRMSIPDVEELYDRVEVGTPIYIG
ncbi:MAG TPA: L,D-transpeptidase/peptidoglycan binding protein [Solirubrobacterales bacterium]|nr:L,D-transpeptidase/peptidoglycan binding protein [Solirubrobacterales bacterium]